MDVMKGTSFARRRRGRWLVALSSLLAALLLVLGLVWAATARASSTFPDVPEGKWFTTWVDQASDAGLMTGYGQGSRQGQFGPGDALTRAQVATVLWRMADKPEPAGAAGFPDVEDGSWYAQAVAWCAETGVVTGYVGGPDDGTFAPDGEVTRAELAAMAWRWARWAGVDAACPDPTAFESTTDSQSVEDWAVEAMTWTAAAGVLTGLDNHDGTYTLDPSGTATRAMAAKVFVVLSGKPVAPKASHTVTFESNGGSAVAPQSVTCGEAASAPDAPEKLDLAFAGWYADAALETPYDFENTPVTTDITVYAKWDEAQAYAVLYSDGTLCLQLGNDTDASHGDVVEQWEWDRTSSPWAGEDHYRQITSIVARDRISLTGDCSFMFSYLDEEDVVELCGLSNCESMDLKKLDVSGVTSFAGMFANDDALARLDIAGWDVPSATDLSGMFSGCPSLASLDIAGWDVSSATDFSGMFWGCSQLGALDLSGWDASNAAFLYGMFFGCSNLETLGLPQWGESKPQYVHVMFYGCSSLKALDLSGLDVSAVESFQRMFRGCSQLGTLDLSGWDVPSASYFEEMFFDCDILSTVTLGEGCAKIADQLGGPWYGADGTQYASIPADALPGTFTKTDPTAQAVQDTMALAALGADVTFDDVALGEEPGLTFEDVEGSPAAEAAATGADQNVDVDVPGDSQPAADQVAGDFAAHADGVDALATPEFADLAGEEAFDLAA